MTKPIAGGSTSNFGLNRLLNLNKSAEGTNLLPPQVGEFRIPFPTQFTLEKTEFIDTQTYFTISWNNVDLDNVAKYVIYVTDARNTFASPIGPYQTTRSPIRIAITAPEGTLLIFTIQTVLNNGFQSLLSGAPSVTGITLA